MTDHLPPGFRHDAIHAGEADPLAADGLTPDLVLASSFQVQPGIGFSATEMQDDTPYFYTRWANPTVRRLERKVAALDGGEDAVCFGSGMAAISHLWLSLLSAGDRLVLSNVCYAGAAELAHDTLPRFGIEVARVDTSDLAAVEAALTPNTKLVHIETPANPILRLSDIRAIAGLAQGAGAQLAVDSTMATPVATRPLDLGADFVVHSLTKYACGHGGDALGGAVIGRQAAMQALRQDALIHMGGTLSPFHAWIILRSLHTLDMRMAAHQQNALALAEAMVDHPGVARVLYPGLPSHPQHALARRQMANFSGMVSLVIRVDPDALARRIASDCRAFRYAVSLGKSKSLAVYIPTEDVLRTSFRLPEAEADAYRAWAGPGVLRLSIGLEPTEQIIDDLSAALHAVG